MVATNLVVTINMVRRALLHYLLNTCIDHISELTQQVASELLQVFRSDQPLPESYFYFFCFVVHNFSCFRLCDNITMWQYFT